MIHTSFVERYGLGVAAEHAVLHDLEDRGWTVEPGPRHFWTPGLNRVLTDWRDSHSKPCFLRWSPDWFVWQCAPRVPSNLYAVDVKCGNGFHIERRALRTYEDFADHFNIPVIVVFDVIGNSEFLAASAGKIALNILRERYGVAEERTPYFEIDPRKLSPMERFFGPKKEKP